MRGAMIAAGSVSANAQPYAIVKVRLAATIDVEKDGVAAPPERNRAPARVRDERKMKALIQGLEEAPKFD